MNEAINFYSGVQVVPAFENANVKVGLQRRVVHAPLTRDRGTRLNPNLTAKAIRIWILNKHIAEHYIQ
ncbi:hypothetical protein E4U53_007105 [Claviceps sorghi]|nr:hypothetical protein E4U53_007105 [Claviceps sorghi]